MINYTSDFPQNPILLNIFANQQRGTAGSLNIDEYINTAWPTELFPKDGIDQKAYGLPSYIENLSPLEDQQKESEWLELVGVDFYLLSNEKRSFLLKTAGIFNFGQEIDIKKVYSTSIY